MKDRKNLVMVLLSSLIVPLFTLIIVELLNKNSTMETILWIKNYRPQVLVSLILYMLIYIIILLLSKRVFLTTLIYSSLLFIIGIINHFKLMLKGEPLLPWDYFSAKAAISILPSMKLVISRRLVLTLAIFIIMLATIALLKFKPIKVKAIFRLPAAAAFLVVLLLFSVKLMNGDYLQTIKITEYSWDQNTNYNENGLLLATDFNLKSMKIKKPTSYSQSLIGNIASSLNCSFETESVNKKPNIIVIMNESYADTRLTHDYVNFEDDPFKVLNNLDGNMDRGNLLVSVYGGGTSNTEFEFLTGFNMASLPLGSNAYQQYMFRDTDSMVSLLKDNNYECVALHPFERSFWNRDKVYPLLGFDKFYSMESFENPEIKKHYIADDEVYKKIIQQYEEKSEDKPLFCFAVTMENHKPYDDPSIDYKLDTGNKTLSQEQLLELKNHTAGVKDSNLMLKSLIEYFKDKDEPTIIVMFGDHQPSLSAPDECSDANKALIDRYSTPYCIWTNYSVKFEHKDIIGSSFLSSYVLKYAGIEVPDYFKLLYTASQEIKGYNPYFTLDSNNNLIKTGEPSNGNVPQLLANLKTVQYDMMFGKQYAKGNLWNVKPNSISSK